MVIRLALVVSIFTEPVSYPAVSEAGTIFALISMVTTINDSR